ncbi:MAG: transglutaminase family protein [Bacteroidota bacterium]
MSLEYTVTYSAKNAYENNVFKAFWQFCIVPEDNDTQELVQWDFENSLNVHNGLSINGLGFRVIRVHPEMSFKTISYKAKFKVIKQEINPFDFEVNQDVEKDFNTILDIPFKTEHEPYLRKTKFTKLPLKYTSQFSFDKSKSIFDNLMELNAWTFEYIDFETGVTDVDTTLDTIILKKNGVCQDFSHLFCAIARENHIPTRYVSGYLHQGNGYFGDSQMHAWVEAFIPHVGWMGFDPTNNLLVNQNHLKVAHGKDYSDCPPIKGVVYSDGWNKTEHSVEVQASQQQ